MPTRLLATGLALLLPVLAVAISVPAGAEPAATAFAPPAAPVVLTRTIHRPLTGGEQIVVSRRYQIRFTPSAGGFRLDGQLLDVQVDAPPPLASLAALERARREPDLFPVLLDAQGMIRKADHIARDSATTERAVAGAQALVADAGLSAELRQELAAALATVTGTAKGTAWPLFLFNPGTAERATSNRIVMPDGAIGEVAVRIRAEQVTPGGLPRLVERTITTRLSGTEQTMREVWSLSF